MALDSIPLQLVRLSGTTGTVLVSAGLPLKKGAVTTSQLAGVRVVIGGVEQPAYVAALYGRHSDGSLRSVLVQFQYSVGSTVIPAALVLGRTRTSTAPSAPLGTPSSTPAVALLPTSPAYLVATDIVGSTRTGAEVTALGGNFARYESDFATFADQLWASGNSTLNENYYDRALVYYSWWARTGKAEYFRRANLLATTYRDTYLVPNAYGASPQWSLLDGLEKHYLLTGAEASRTAVGVTAERIRLGYVVYWPPSSWEGRIWARALEAMLVAWRLSAPTAVGQASFASWGTRLDEALNATIVLQQADGSYNPTPGSCSSRYLNYMTAMVNHSYIRLYEEYRQDARIPGAVKRAGDYLWNTQWIPASKAFKYSGMQCDFGGPAPAADINGFFVTTYGFIYKQTGDAAYKTIGETVFNATVTGSYLYGTKQFTETYHSTYRYFSMR